MNIENSIFTVEEIKSTILEQKKVIRQLNDKANHYKVFFIINAVVFFTTLTLFWNPATLVFGIISTLILGFKLKKILNKASFEILNNIIVEDLNKSMYDNTIIPGYLLA